MGASIVATSEPTSYPPNGEPRTLDFFVVDQRLMPAIGGIEVVHDLPLIQHRAVRLTLNVRATKYMIMQPVKPAPLPRVPPVGCAREPLDVDIKDDVVGLRPYSVDAVTAVDECWTKVVGALEHELCGRCDLVDGNGKPLNKFTGRDRPIRTVQRQALPPKAAGMGLVNMGLHAKVWAASRIQQIADISNSVATHGLSSEAQGQQRSKHKRRFIRRDGLVAFLIKEDHQTWQARCDVVAEHRLGDSDAMLLEAIAQQIITEAENARCKLQHGATRAWKEWV